MKECPASTLIANSVLSSSLNVNVRWLVESKFVILIYLTSYSSNHIVLTFRDEDNTEFKMKVDAGHSFIYPGDNSGGVVDTMKAAGSALASGLSDLVDITVDADTAACDVEIFVGSA